MKTYILHNSADIIKVLAKDVYVLGQVVKPRKMYTLELQNIAAVIKYPKLIHVHDYTYFDVKDAIITAYSAFTADVPKAYTNPMYDIYAYSGYREELLKVYEILRNDIYSRQAVWLLDPSKCTNMVQFLYRYDKLNLIVNTRSCDIVKKSLLDIAFVSLIHQIIANALKVNIGQIHWNISSAHMYFEDAEFFNNLDVDELRVTPLAPANKDLDEDYFRKIVALTQI